MIRRLCEKGKNCILGRLSNDCYNFRVDDTVDAQDEEVSIVEATQRVDVGYTVRKIIAAGRRMNRAYCDEMPGLTVSSK